jgi:2-polyprenyl-3-methyl-5-hydroxy-6-metoxy-1,4-benzoquinol methylase
MPSSTFAAIGPIMAAIEKIKPTSVLDVGCGNGKYGFLCREYIEYWLQKTPIIHGIEGFRPYVKGWRTKKIYDNIEIGNAIDVLIKRNEKLRGIKYYDAVLAIDILEHFNEEDGKLFIRELKRIGKNVIICTPTIVKEQGACFGNEYEIHKKQWTPDEIEPDGPNRQVLVGRENFTIVVITE